MPPMYLEYPIIVDKTVVAYQLSMNLDQEIPKNN